ncbi:cysteine desulfurase [Candidatus Acidianus copahuensis]|uniref:Cysteine desulfurase n=1 Tax=Candidatus Acidianus copahuensis TaxID=1160895 RepID=A0A031LKQ8_9CREN|nr:aminotransferase class V-fold PLP-dependent enzyme [Candidatus Acidianus copahuensis]EZQ02080.1 cysteine desulfurase [Candidatus Acidianus copahuensis]
MFCEDFRTQVPITQKYIYLNHAAISPTPLPVLFETFRYLYEVANDGSLADNREEQDELLHIRQKISKLINSEPQEISFIPNTSYGINVIAHSLLSKGDEVITDSLEFPATVYPFIKLKSKGIKLNLIDVTPYDIEDKIISQLNDRTKLVVISHVSFNTGVKIDVKRISEEIKKVGGYILLDVIQSLGTTKVDVKDLNVDFAVAGGYKWMMSPQGSGFLYVKNELIKDPPFYGWKTSKNYLDFDAKSFSLEEGPRRFEIGTIDIAANLGMAKSAEILQEHNSEIEKRVKELSDHAIDSATDKGLEVITPKEKKAGIVVVKTENPRKVSVELMGKGIITSPRGNGIRISTHFYNTLEEVEKTISSIYSIVTK